MSKFTLKRIDAVKGRIKIFKLLVDMNCEFDRFCKSLEDEKKDDIIGSLFATLEAYANLKMLPGTKFKDSNGGIVVFGGFKKRQKNDIKRFRSIKHDYIKTTRK